MIMRFLAKVFVLSAIGAIVVLFWRWLNPEAPSALYACAWVAGLWLYMEWKDAKN